MSLRFGILWPFRNPEFARVPWEQLYRSHLDLIADSEAMGFDDAWLTEHHFVDDGYSPSLLPIAGAVAARTTRIRIGTFLVLLPLHNPVRLAEDTATPNAPVRAQRSLPSRPRGDNCARLPPAAPDRWHAGFRYSCQGADPKPPPRDRSAGARLPIARRCHGSVRWRAGSRLPPPWTRRVQRGAAR